MPKKPVAALWILWAVYTPTSALAHRTPFERYLQPTALAVEQQTMAEVARNWAHTAHRELTYDPRLALAASSQLKNMARSANHGIDMEALVHAGWSAGWTDGQVMAIGLTGAGAHLPRLLQQELMAQTTATQWTHMGIASQPVASEGVWNAIIALSERPLALAPLPAHRRPRQSIRIHGLVRDPAITTLHLTYATPSSRIYSRSVTLGPWHAFDCRIRAPAESGEMMLEMMIERGRGPELAAQMPIEVGHAAPGPHLSSGSTPAAQAVAPHAVLESLILGLRRSHGLALPQSHDGLHQVAARRLSIVMRSDALTHLDGEGWSVVEQLHDARIAFQHVVENLGEAATPFDIFEAWRESPSHLENLLDPNVDALGVAIDQQTEGGPYTAALVMAHIEGAQ